MELLCQLSGFLFRGVSHIFKTSSAIPKVYQKEQILVCPYCENEKSEEALGCCGESSAHFEWVDVEEE